MSRELYQTDASYRRTLIELRHRAEIDIRLEYFDDTTSGAKRMGCNLGLCDETIKKDGIYRASHHHCPHDRRFFTEHGIPAAPPENDTGSGCFHTCRIFKGTRRERSLAKSRILEATKEAL